MLYHAEQYLTPCLESLLGIEYDGKVEILLRDQSPRQAAKKYLEKHLPHIFKKLPFPPDKVNCEAREDPLGDKGGEGGLGKNSEQKRNERKQKNENLQFFLNNKEIIVSAGDNLGHSGGHNTLIKHMHQDSQYYICASHDMLYSADFAKKIITKLEQESDFAAATGKLLRWNFEEILPFPPDKVNCEAREDPLRDKRGEGASHRAACITQSNSKNQHQDWQNVLEKQKTNIIDSCGICGFLNHYFTDLGQGQKDEGQYDHVREIFGGSGALVVLSRRALESIQYNDQYYDELMHYKNDIDLAYRLQWAGIKTLFVPEAICWHDRQVRNIEGNTGLIAKILNNRQHKSRSAKLSSYWGHLVMLDTNVWRRPLSLATKLRTWLYQLQTLGFVLLFEPYLLTVLVKKNNCTTQITTKKKLIKIHNSPRRIEFFLRQKNLVKHPPQQSKNNTVSVIIVDFMKAKQVVKNVDSLLAQKTSFDLEIIIIDNSCDKENAKILQQLKQKKNVTVIINQHNIGYPKPHNIAAKYATGEVIFVINPDIECQDIHTLQILWDKLKKNSHLGIIGPQQINPDGSIENTARRFPSLLMQILRRVDNIRNIWPFDHRVKKYEMRDICGDAKSYTSTVDWLQSSCIAIKRQCWDEVGGFDERFFLFMSDVEICRQAHKIGWQVVYEPAVQVIADGRRASSGGIKAFFTRKTLRIHCLDAIKYHWKKIWN